MKPDTMKNPFSSRRLFGIVLCSAALLVGFGAVRAEGQAVALPNPAVDVAPAPAGQQTAVFAGGCFWGVEAVFRHVNGVISATSGYAGGNVKNPGYELVSSGTTGHAESVKVVYDPAKVSYGQLLKVYFSVAHDPTELNRQGPDSVTQYRSEIFATSDDQARVAKAYIAQLQAAKAYPRPIVTKVEQLPAVGGFYAAEDYHQNYLALHPNQPYIVINDLPKVANLKTTFPALYRN
jgi:peptide-methionine (S)-S-oxide reductase